MRDDESAGGFDAFLAVDDVDRTVEELVSEAFRRSDELSTTLFEHVRRNVPSYGHGRSSLEVQDLRLSIGRLGTILIDCVRKDKVPPEQDLVSLTMIGAQRAREGVAKEDALKTFRLCVRGTRTFLLGASQADRAPSTGTAFAAAATIADRLDRCGAPIESALEAGYAEVDDEVARRGGVRNEASVANLILGRRWEAESDLRAHLIELGRPLGRTHGVSVLVPAGKVEGLPLAEAARQVSRSVRGTTLLAATSWTPLPHVPMILSLSSTDWRVVVSRLDAAAARHGVIAVVSEPVEELDQLQRVYVSIRRDLGYLRAARSDAGAVTAQRLDLFAAIAGDGRDLGRMTRIVSRVFGKVDQHTNADALLTLIGAFYRSSGVWERIGEDLGLHRNTVVGRAEKIEELTGLNFRDVADCHELMTVYRLREMLRAHFDLLDGDDAA